MHFNKDIFITNSIKGFSGFEFDDFLSYALCLGGECKFIFNGMDFELHKGDLMVTRRSNLIEYIRPSKDFKVKNIMVKYSIIQLCSPQTNYGVRSHLSLFTNPVMKLNERQVEICKKDFDWIEYRLSQTEHKFYNEILYNAIQSTILDFFDFHYELNEGSKVTQPLGSVMSRFLAMLENKEFRKYREVSYYADVLCVTPKYLSEISKKVSGYGAHYWIKRYTLSDLSYLLRDKTLSFVEIADMFNFSSLAYFSRYIQNNLGLSPSQVREGASSAR